MISCQSEGCAPISTAFDKGERFAKLFEGAAAAVVASHSYWQKRQRRGWRTPSRNFQVPTGREEPTPKETKEKGPERDPCLAEDAAQDAFLLAWERLDQLREPAAFPGWIRRLVVTQCHRRLRGRRLDLGPQEEAVAVAAAADVASQAEASDTATLVRAALGQLAPDDRLVLILAYGSERSHEEIAAWLRVPVTTVSRRLAHAKNRLRRRTLDGLSGGLRSQRRAAGEAFVMEFSARLRRAAPDDAAGIASLASHLGLDRRPALAPLTPCAYVVEDPVLRTPIAYAAAVQTIFKPIYELHLAIGDDALERHAGDVLLAQVVQDMAACNAIALQHRTSGGRVAVVDFLRSRGFDVVERAQDWRRPAGSPSAAKVAGAPWEFRSIEALSEHPPFFQAALDLLTEAIADLPSGPAVLPIHPDTLRRTLARQHNGVVALAEDGLHAIAASSSDDLVPGAARVNMMVVRKNRRRQGLATALLTRLLAQQGDCPARVVVDTTPELRSWLTGRGFAEAANTLLLERVLRKTVSLALEHLDEFVGRYVIDDVPGGPHVIDIERHGDSLVSKSRDMRDLLLPRSKTEFFTRHHYGHGRFERDPSGRVVRLVVIEEPHELVAIRE
jgi:RNA polymerase sigma factor (sigma-70 family)